MPEQLEYDAHLNLDVRETLAKVLRGEHNSTDVRRLLARLPITFVPDSDPPMVPLCWQQDPQSYTACDRKRGHLGLHTWERVAFLTDEEHDAVTAAGRVMTQVVDVCGDSAQTRDIDLTEIQSFVHGIQNAILAQAAARAYPDRYRLMGGRCVVEEEETREAS
jgi:hypothetical protein